MSSSTDEHWEGVYGRKAPQDVSWYRPHLELSLGFIEAARLDPESGIIDVGAGASTLVDDLLARGYRDVTLLDLSARALEVVRARLGAPGTTVQYLVGDVTTIRLDESRYDLWHDRAVFHFLTDGTARLRYVEAARQALKAGGHVVIGTFGPDGPTKCSGLDVCRYSSQELAREFRDGFELMSEASEVHQTPWSASQSFIYVHLRRL